MKTRKLFLYILITAILGLILQLFLHEFGHMFFAICTGNKIETISFGSSSYTGIQVVDESSIAIISLGSFILPILFYIVMSFIKNMFISLLNMFVGVITALQLGINSIAIVITDKTSEVYNTYDLGIFVNATNINLVVCSMVALAIAICLLIFAVYVGVKNILKKI